MKAAIAPGSSACLVASNRAAQANASVAACGVADTGAPLNAIRYGYIFGGVSGSLMPAPSAEAVSGRAGNLARQPLRERTLLGLRHGI